MGIISALELWNQINSPRINYGERRRDVREQKCEVLRFINQKEEDNLVKEAATGINQENVLS